MQISETRYGEIWLQPIARDMFTRIRQLLPCGIVGMRK